MNEPTYGHLLNDEVIELLMHMATVVRITADLREEARAKYLASTETYMSMVRLRHSVREEMQRRGLSFVHEEAG